MAGDATPVALGRAVLADVGLVEFPDLVAVRHSARKLETTRDIVAAEFQTLLNGRPDAPIYTEIRVDRNSLSLPADGFGDERQQPGRLEHPRVDIGRRGGRSGTQHAVRHPEHESAWPAPSAAG